MSNPTSSKKKRGAPFGNRNAQKIPMDPKKKRISFGTTISPETEAYILSMKTKIKPGRLVDAAIALYRAVRKDE